eukprot:4390361-Alexandrium_andersonii.AAC.1
MRAARAAAGPKKHCSLLKQLAMAVPSQRGSRGPPGLVRLRAGRLAAPCCGWVVVRSPVVV